MEAIERLVIAGPHQHEVVEFPGDHMAFQATGHLDDGLLEIRKRSSTTPINTNMLALSIWGFSRATVRLMMPSCRSRLTRRKHAGALKFTLAARATLEMVASRCKARSMARSVRSMSAGRLSGALLAEEILLRMGLAVGSKRSASPEGTV
jgi:hypothetical protein